MASMHSRKSRPGFFLCENKSYSIIVERSETTNNEIVYLESAETIAGRFERTTRDRCRNELLDAHMIVTVATDDEVREVGVALDHRRCAIDAAFACAAFDRVQHELVHRNIEAAKRRTARAVVANDRKRTSRRQPAFCLISANQQTKKNEKTTHELPLPGIDGGGVAPRGVQHRMLSGVLRKKEVN